jgi:hypothetical protein
MEVAERQAPDATETVDCDTNGHVSFSFEGKSID